MTKFIAGIGIPGSGKSSYLKPFAERYGYAYVSTDEVREELFGSVLDMTHEPEVAQEVRNRIARYLEEQQTVVLDSTFSRQEDRLQLIEFARAHGAEKVQGIYIDVPVELAKERNAQREIPIRESAIDRMDLRFKEAPVELTDGFDSIVVFDGQHEVREVRLRDGVDEVRREFKVR